MAFSKNQIEAVLKTRGKKNELQEMTGIVKQHTDTLSWHEKLLNATFGMMIGVVLVLFVAFIALVVTTFLEYKSSYNSFNDSVRQLQNDRYQFLKDRIDLLDTDNIPNSTNPQN